MATVDKTGGATASVPYIGLNKHYIIRNLNVDISTAVNAEIDQLLPIHANTLVKNVIIQIVTANDAATSSAIEVGDGSDVDGFIDTVDCKGTALAYTKGAFLSDEAYTKAGGKIYTAADTIDAVFAVTGTNTAGKINIWAECIDLN